jgi:hypothetical protein
VKRKNGKKTNKKTVKNEKTKGVGGYKLISSLKSSPAFTTLHKKTEYPFATKMFY